MNAIKSERDVQVLWVGGALLVGLAACFLWRDLALGLEYVCVVLAMGAGGVTLLRPSGRWPWLAPLGLLAAELMTLSWWGATRAPALVPALGCACAFALAAVVRSRPGDSQPEKARHLLTWYGLAVAALGFSAAAYFHFITLGIGADEVMRRPILTLAWMATGVGLVRLARARADLGARDAGFAFIALAVLKAVAYDTTHLGGWLRVGSLALGTALLWGGAVMVSRVRRA